jgi:uncharacterized repeat protein (TIGR02543 family)
MSSFMKKRVSQRYAAILLALALGIVAIFPLGAFADAEDAPPDGGSLESEETLEADSVAEEDEFVVETDIETETETDIETETETDIEPISEEPEEEVVALDTEDIPLVTLQTADVSARFLITVLDGGANFRIEGLAGAAVAAYEGKEFALATTTVELNGIYGDFALLIDGANKQGDTPLDLKLNGVNMVTGNTVSDPYGLANSTNLSGAAPVGLFNGANVRVTAIGDNVLTAPGVPGHYAGLQAPTGTTLVLTSETAGNITARGTYLGAGIGSSIGQDTGKIIIEGNVNVWAYGGNWSPGIGAAGGGTINSGLGGDLAMGHGGSADITIRGDAVIREARGLNFGAGIGIGGISYDDGCPTFEGGSARIVIGGNAQILSAAAGSNAAGIGGAQLTKDADITIEEDAHIFSAVGSGSGAGIGSGSVWAIGYFQTEVSQENASFVTIKDRAKIDSAVGGANAAGIGAGYVTNLTVVSISGDATIQSATGGTYGAGIGSGAYVADTDVSITGNATIQSATGGTYGAGIGGGYTKAGEDSIVTVAISGKAVIESAHGGTSTGAGIGAGYSPVGLNADVLNADVVVKISGEAKIESAVGGSNAAGIGGGVRTKKAEVLITDKAVIEQATSTKYGSGIGSGWHSAETSVTINGEAVIKEAIGGECGAGIGGGEENKTVGVLISGKSVIEKAEGGEGGAGIGNGYSAYTAAQGFDATVVDVKISGNANVKEAIGGVDGAGIGSGLGTDGPEYTTNVNIAIEENAKVELAQGGTNGAGVGSARFAQGGTITLSGKASLKAVGADGANGIGNGASSSGIVVVTGKNTKNIVAYAKNNHAIAPGGTAGTHAQNLFISSDSTDFLDVTGGSDFAIDAILPDGTVKAITLPAGYTSFAYTNSNTGDHAHLGNFSGVKKQFVDFNNKGKIPNNSSNFAAVALKLKDIAVHLVKYEPGADIVTEMPSPVMQAGEHAKTFAVASAAPKRAGYDFSGWLRKDNNKTYQAGENFTMPNKDVTLVAQWTLTQTTVPPDPQTPEPPAKPEPKPPAPAKPVVVVEPPKAEVTPIEPVNEPVIPESQPQVSPIADITKSSAGTASASVAGFTIADEAKIEAQTGNIFADIANGNVPLGNLLAKGAWSLLSMIFAVLALVMAITMIVGRKNEQNRILRILAICFGLLTPIIWVILEDFSQPVAWINQHTIIIAIIFAITVAQFLFYRVRHNDEDKADALL